MWMVTAVSLPLDGFSQQLPSGGWSSQQAFPLLSLIPWRDGAPTRGDREGMDCGEFYGPHPLI